MGRITPDEDKLMPRITKPSATCDDSGAVAIIFAFSVIPITMLTALVIDYGWVMQAKSKLDLAADAAALAGARTAAAGYAGGQTSDKYLPEAVAAANQWWTAQAGSVPQAHDFTETPTITQNGNNFTATVAYTATVNEILPNLFQNGTANTGSGDGDGGGKGGGKGGGDGGDDDGGKGDGGDGKGGDDAKVGSGVKTADSDTPPSATTGAKIANTISASITVNAYGTLDFLLDNTSSMMLPATDNDLQIYQAKMRQILPASVSLQNSVQSGGSGLVGWDGGTGGWLLVANTIGSNTYVSNGGTSIPLASVPSTQFCAFACHWSAVSTAANPTDYYGIARASGETMRFDVVQSATATAIQQMETLEKAVGQLSVGVYAFGGVDMSSPSYLKPIFPEAPIDTTINGHVVRNAGAIAAIAALKTITPPVTLDVPNTNVGVALSDLQSTTGPAGAGNTALTPRKSVIMVTDGIEDDTNPQSIPRTEGPINPAICNAMKSAGYTIYVLYTPYNAAAPYLPFNIALQPYITGASTPSVLSALQSCASSASDVIIATAPDQIQAGMVTLINEAVGSTTRLTN